MTVTEYYKMPLLHRTEDIDRCLFSTEDYNVLCIVFTIIKPDNTSELWNQIEVFSDDVKRHYRHDFIHAGMCLKTCEQQLSELTELERDRLFVEEFPWKIGRKVHLTCLFYSEVTSLENHLLCFSGMMMEQLLMVRISIESCTEENLTNV